MPNLDGGHYFLTALLPVDNDGIVEHGPFRSSPIHMVRDALEALPTALQSKAAEEIGIQSPFARSPRTHLARLVVIDAPHDNGRDPADSIITAARGTDLLAPQPVDRLSCPYLLFCADFDPVGDEPRSYLEELWTVAERELSSVFQYCYGFGAVKDAAGFADFVIAGQVETTMPFNDYWTQAPPLPSLPYWYLAVAPAVALFAGIAVWAAAGYWPVGVAILLAVLAGAVYVDYALVMKVGAKPFPAAPNSSLRHVLKALYLQQAFARFVANQQDADPAARRDAFTAFVAQHRPSDLDGPTQPPGVIRSQIPEANAHA